MIEIIIIFTAILILIIQGKNDVIIII